MDGKVNVTIRGRTELTKKRHQIDLLLKKAMRGGKQAQSRLSKEFGIRVYSSREVGDYVRERLGTEVIEDSPFREGVKEGSKAISKRRNRRAIRRR